MANLSSYRKKADKAMQEYYRLKNLRCELCTKPAQLMHHYFPKSKATALRYDEDNLIPVCQSCHFHHHNGDPRLHARVLAKQGQKWHEQLEKKKNTIVKLSKGYYLNIISNYKKL